MRHEQPTSFLPQRATSALVLFRVPRRAAAVAGAAMGAALLPGLVALAWEALIGWFPLLWAALLPPTILQYGPRF